MAQGIDFTGLIRGQQMADNANWANIRRIQDQDTYAIQREEQLAKQLQQRQGREASTYLSTILPNLQRYADQGLNPVDALINQRAAIQNDQAFQSMSPEVQTQILNGLGQTASLHMQALKNSGDYTNLQKLVSTFGGTNPINQLGAAVASGDPTSIFNAVKARGAAIELIDGNVVDTATGRKVPLTDWAAYTAAGLGTENSAAGSYGAFQAQGQQDRTLSAAEAQQKQSDTYQAALALQSGMDPAVVKSIFKAADPAVFTAGAPVIPGAAAGPTVATPEQVAALNTPIVPGAATPGAAPAAVETPAPVWQQLVTQIQAATAPQLDSSLTTIVEQIKTGAARAQQLQTTKQQLKEQVPIYAAAANKEGGVTGPARRMLLAIQQQITQIDTEAQALTKNMQGFTQLAQQIQTRKQLLGLPAMGAAPASDWLTKLQGNLPKLQGDLTK